MSAAGMRWMTNRTFPRDRSPSRFVVIASSLLLAGVADGALTIQVFSGALERVTEVSVSIRLDDGRIIESRDTATRGDLAPHNLAGRYSVGDRVEIACVSIKGVYESVLGRRMFLELKRVKSLGKPSAGERQVALTSKAWRQPPNLLAEGPAPEVGTNQPAPDAEWQARLDQIRSRVLAFVAAMPNFVADEVAQRYVSSTDPPEWRPLDTIDSEITFKGNAASRDHIVVSGKPWNQGYRALPGFKWTDTFGSQLSFLFDEKCPTAFEFEGTVAEDGKSLSAIRYQSPPDGCEFYWQDYQQFYPAKTGRLLLDEQAGNVVRLETEAGGFPKAFPIVSVRKQVSWDDVKIADATHLLPVSAEITVVLATGEMRLSRNEYKNHRHFEAASSITFH